MTNDKPETPGAFLPLSTIRPRISVIRHSSFGHSSFHPVHQSNESYLMNALTLLSANAQTRCNGFRTLFAFAQGEVFFNVVNNIFPHRRTAEEGTG